MALMAAKGEILPMPDAAIFADTGDEPKAVYDWLTWLETQLPFPVHRVRKGKISEDSLLVRTSKKSGNKYINALIPAYNVGPKGTGMLGRTCTLKYKIEPILKKCKELASIKRAQKEVTVKMWIGISWDEMRRMKTSRVPWVENIWPLIDLKMTRSDCLKWMSKAGYPAPPRSACIFCPFHSDKEWNDLKKDEIEFSKAVSFEANLQAAAAQSILKGIPYLHKSGVTLDKVIFKDDPKTHNQLDMGFNNECEGLCGV